MVVPEVKITKMVILFFFKRDKTKESSIYTQNSWIMDICWPFCNWQKCSYSSNVQIKYKYCFLLQIFMFQLSSVLTPRLHTSPASTINASLDPFEAFATFLNRLHWNQGRSRALGKWVERGWGHILLFMVNILLVTDFSVLKKKMLS